jgi:hypothetical protein
VVNYKGAVEGDRSMNKRILVLFVLLGAIFLSYNGNAKAVKKVETRVPEVGQIVKKAATRDPIVLSFTVKNELGMYVMFRCFDEENNEVCTIDCEGDEKITMHECHTFEFEIPLSFDNKTLTMKKRIAYTDLKPGYDYLLMKSGRQQPDGSFNLCFIRDPHQVFED